MSSEQTKRVHELITTLRNDGYNVAYGAAENEDFAEHAKLAREALEADGLMGYYLTVMAPGQTDYYSSTVVEGQESAMALAQIQMLGSHFRTVLEATGLDTTTLIDAMVDEALTIEEIDDE